MLAGHRRRPLQLRGLEINAGASLPGRAVPNAGHSGPRLLIHNQLKGTW